MKHLLRAFAITASAAALVACMPLYSERPIYRDADAKGPPLREGLWVVEGLSDLAAQMPEDARARLEAQGGSEAIEAKTCTYDVETPVKDWPSCAGWWAVDGQRWLTAQREPAALEDPFGAAAPDDGDGGDDSDEARAPAQVWLNESRFILASGPPTVIQFEYATPEGPVFGYDFVDGDIDPALAAYTTVNLRGFICAIDFEKFADMANPPKSMKSVYPALCRVRSARQLASIGRGYEAEADRFQARFDDPDNPPAPSDDPVRFPVMFKAHWVRALRPDDLPPPAPAPQSAEEIESAGYAAFFQLGFPVGIF